jgi:peroxiredoxin
MAGKVELNVMAPDFSLTDFGGQLVRLVDFRGDRHVILVFNRGFM